MSGIYYMDRYREGQMRDIRGPFGSLDDARERLSVGESEISVKSCDSVVEMLRHRHHGASIRLIESWESESESDFDCIYSVETGGAR
jgi:hypothetical protein